MEVLGGLATINGLLGELVGVVKYLVREIKRAKEDVTTLRVELEHLEREYLKLRDRVTQVEATEYRSREGGLQELLNELRIGLERDLVDLCLYKDVEQKQRAQGKIKRVTRALIRKGATKLQILIKNIRERIEADCKQLDRALAVQTFIAMDRFNTLVETLMGELRLRGPISLELNRLERILVILQGLNIEDFLGFLSGTRIEGVRWRENLEHFLAVAGLVAGLFTQLGILWLVVKYETLENLRRNLQQEQQDSDLELPSEDWGFYECASGNERDELAEYLSPTVLTLPFTFPTGKCLFEDQVIVHQSVSTAKVS